ncbi:hypothetical protein Tco_0024067 [Tanacetum coccineum]
MLVCSLHVELPQLRSPLASHISSKGIGTQCTGAHTRAAVDGMKLDILLETRSNEYASSFKRRKSLSPKGCDELVKQSVRIQLAQNYGEPSLGSGVLDYEYESENISEVDVSVLPFISRGIVSFVTSPFSVYEEQLYPSIEIVLDYLLEDSELEENQEVEFDLIPSEVDNQN